MLPARQALLSSMSGSVHCGTLPLSRLNARPLNGSETSDFEASGCVRLDATNSSTDSSFHGDPATDSSFHGDPAALDSPAAVWLPSPIKTSPSSKASMRLSCTVSPSAPELPWRPTPPRRAEQSQNVDSICADLVCQMTHQFSRAESENSPLRREIYFY
jgi:hypothetical protein